MADETKLSPSVYWRGSGNNTLMVPVDTRRRSSVSSADEDMNEVLSAYMAREKRKRSSTFRCDVTKIDTSQTQGNIVLVSVLITISLSAVVLLSWYFGKL